MRQHLPRRWISSNAVGSANRSCAIICSAFRAIEMTSTLNLAHDRHTGHREDQILSEFKRSVIDEGNSGTPSRGEDATPQAAFRPLSDVNRGELPPLGHVHYASQPL
jgi:hypothetical protein